MSSRVRQTWQPVVCPGNEQCELHSTITGRSYRLLVSIPATPAPADGYPVLYLLDGNLLFQSADALARVAAHASRRLGIDMAPPLIVGIGHVDAASLYHPARSEDYTPPTADRFLHFIENELKPLIESRHGIDRTRQALAGHSYGGLFVLHTLFTRAHAFQTYVAGSPSIWWNQRCILAEKDRFIAHAKTAPIHARLLITVGELEQTPTPERDGSRRDTVIHERCMVDNARALANELMALPRDVDLPVRFQVMPDENHIGAALPMLAQALKFFRQPHSNT